MKQSEQDEYEKIAGDALSISPSDETQRAYLELTRRVNSRQAGAIFGSILATRIPHDTSEHFRIYTLAGMVGVHSGLVADAGKSDPAILHEHLAQKFSVEKNIDMEMARWAVGVWVEVVQALRDAADGKSVPLLIPDIPDVDNTPTPMTEDDIASICRMMIRSGNADYQYQTGLLFLYGKSITQDDKAAADLFLAAAEKGHAGAQYAIGYCYSTGKGVIKDDAIAVEWYRKAAEQGDARAQAGLAWHYQNGAGVVKDEVEAIQWLIKAAEQDNTWSMMNLGECYEKGEGVEKDIETALAWYRKAASLGDEDAIEKLNSITTRDNGTQPH